MGIKGSNKFEDSKMKSKAVWAIIMIFTFFIIIIYKTTVNTQKSELKNINNSAYFKNFNESFKGFVVDKKKTSQWAGIKELFLIKIKLTESTIDYYDPRDSIKLYFCVIDYPFAEFFSSSSYNHVEIGDSCSFNGETDELCIEPYDVSWNCGTPELNRNIAFYKDLHTILPKSNLEKFKKRGYYRIFIDKFKTEEEINKFRSDHRKSTYSVYEVLVSRDYIKTKTNDSIYVYHKDKFYSYNSAYDIVKDFNYKNCKIIKYDKNGKEIKVVYPQVKQLKLEMKSYPEPFNISDDYYMLLFMKTKDKKKVHQYYKELEKKVYYSEDLTLSHKHFERRAKSYYLFYSDKRYGNYKDAVKAWKKAGFNELYIVKFDKHNKFIKIMEKRKKRN